MIDRIQRKKFSMRGSNINDLLAIQDLCNYLHTHYMDISTICMAEIGSMIGDSSEQFALRVKTIVCIDAWDHLLFSEEKDQRKYEKLFPEIEKMFDDVVIQYNNIIKYKMESTTASNNFPNNYFDFIYIDADHSYESVKRDLSAWLPKIKFNGWIGGHDYDNENFPGVHKAVVDILGGSADITFLDTSWLKKI